MPLDENMNIVSLIAAIVNNDISKKTEIQTAAAASIEQFDKIIAAIIEVTHPDWSLGENINRDKVNEVLTNFGLTDNYNAALECIFTNIDLRYTIQDESKTNALKEYYQSLINKYGTGIYTETYIIAMSASLLEIIISNNLIVKLWDLTNTIITFIDSLSDEDKQKYYYKARFNSALA